MLWCFHTTVGYISDIVQHSYLPTMPEDNFAECIAVIAETMRGTGVPGEWYG